MYSTLSVTRKPAIVERFNRTMKQIMWKYYIENQTDKWIDVLPDIVDLCNNRFHHALQMTPTQARLEDNRTTVSNYMSSKSDFYMKFG